MQGDMASAILRAWRMLLSVCPTREPMSTTSRINVGRPTSLPRALQKADLSTAGRRKQQDALGTAAGIATPLLAERPRAESLEVF